MSGGPAPKHVKREEEEYTPSTAAIQAAETSIAAFTASIAKLEKKLEDAEAELKKWSARVDDDSYSDPQKAERQQSFYQSQVKDVQAALDKEKDRLLEEKKLLLEKEKLIAQSGKKVTFDEETVVRILITLSLSQQRSSEQKRLSEASHTKRYTMAFDEHRVRSVEYEDKPKPPNIKTLATELGSIQQTTSEDKDDKSVQASNQEPTTQCTYFCHTVYAIKAEVDGKAQHMIIDPSIHYQPVLNNSGAVTISKLWFKSSIAWDATPSINSNQLTEIMYKAAQIRAEVKKQAECIRVARDLIDYACLKNLGWYKTYDVYISAPGTHMPFNTAAVDLTDIQQNAPLPEEHVHLQCDDAIESVKNQEKGVAYWILGDNQATLKYWKL